MQEVALTQGRVALVDDEDWEEVNKHKWCAHRGTGKQTWYAKRSVWRKDEQRQVTVCMHDAILGGDPRGRRIDHADGDGLNNQRGNLRFATSEEQARNRPAHRNNKTGLKGVTYTPGHPRPYRTVIRIDGRQVHLGYFFSPEDAAIAYDTKAIEVYGEFARLNFPLTICKDI